jgi:hypothetical protein
VLLFFDVLVSVAEKSRANTARFNMFRKYKLVGISHVAVFSDLQGLEVNLFYEAISLYRCYFSRI